MPTMEYICIFSSRSFMMVLCLMCYLNGDDNFSLNFPSHICCSHYARKKHSSFYLFFAPQSSCFNSGEKLKILPTATLFVYFRASHYCCCLCLYFFFFFAVATAFIFLLLVLFLYMFQTHTHSLFYIQKVRE